MKLILAASDRCIAEATKQCSTFCWSLLPREIVFVCGTELEHCPLAFVLDLHLYPLGLCLSISPMSTFAQLMALSTTQTAQTKSAVQAALAERERRQQLKLKQQAEAERKERDERDRRLQKMADDEKREAERLRAVEEKRKAQEATRLRREEEQRDALRYGPKKAKTIHSSEGPTQWPSSSSQSKTRDEPRKRRLPSDEEDNQSRATANTYTREELRAQQEKRRLAREERTQQEKTRMFPTQKRPTQTGTRRKKDGTLPGGAVDITTPNHPIISSNSTLSIRERLIAMPNTLTKLNTVKRDLRTEDEILTQVRGAKEAKVLQGDDARAFDGYFTSRKKEKPRLGSAVPSTPAASRKCPFQRPLPLHVLTLDSRG